MLGLSLARLYVLVEAEHVCRIVLVLEDDQPLVRLRVEGRADALLAIVTDKVQVDALAHLRSHHRLELPDPAYIFRLFGRVSLHPDRVNVEGRVPEGERRLTIRHPAQRSSHREHMHLR